MLVVTVINVDAYPFLAFLDLICRLKDRCFMIALCRLTVMRPNVEVATERLVHQQVEMPG